MRTKVYILNSDGKSLNSEKKNLNLGGKIRKF